MERILIVLAIVAAAAAVAALIQRSRPATPIRTGWTTPEQLNRADFSRPDSEWLVAVFTSATCDACADVLTKAQVLQSDAVEVAEIEYNRDRAIHDRYAIEAVPAVLLADASGVVRGTQLGPVSVTHLWAMVAEAREPGSTPDGCS